ncbi:uncharacterized protein C8R40DRAFT_1066979 [Lentinula edodes]|uniref:uncharacterized protein n=1 Tax=Lentinula edodes TaxID=5353 RepID=UPI001E8DAD24|nr:uncharacterized protein C8R40DRAFT_1066979 [Lentinula edodes]KAH7878540.1 hypothetical protein C8R40DRAFT_1066979 [Lentinula edodes]
MAHNAAISETKFAERKQLCRWKKSLFEPQTLCLHFYSAYPNNVENNRTSSNTANGAVLTAYTSTQERSLMALALSHLPPATASSSLMIQVPNVTPAGETYTVPPTLPNFATVLPILPENIVVLASATSEETVHLSQSLYQLSASHVIHVFNHFSSSGDWTPLTHQLSTLTVPHLRRLRCIFLNKTPSRSFVATLIPEVEDLVPAIMKKPRPFTTPSTMLPNLPVLVERALSMSWALYNETILKTHSDLKYAKPRSTIFLVSTCSAEELFSNLPGQVTTLIVERELRPFIINVPDVTDNLTSAIGQVQDVISNVVSYLAFMKMYFGAAPTEENVSTFAAGSYGETVEGDALEQALFIKAPAEKKPVELKEFESNPITVKHHESDTVVNAARLGTWHDAAKHLLFPPIFAAPTKSTDEEFPQYPSLRLEFPERTFLVTCIVNRC